MKCSKCGAQCNDNLAFCLECGNPLQLMADFNLIEKELANSIGEFMDEMEDEKEQDIELQSLLPGDHEIRLNLRGMWLPAGNYTIAVGLVDPMSERPGVAFANEGEIEEKMYQIMEFTIER